MAEIHLNAQIRDKDKQTNKALRRAGLVPGVYYTKTHDVKCLQFEKNSINQLLKREIGLLHLDLNGQALPCIIREVQRHPTRGDVVHVDLYGVAVGQKIKARVQFHAIGTPVGLKEGGTLDIILREIEIECLPKDLPTYLDIDVTNLKINDAIRIGDLHFEGITLHGDANSTVAHVLPPRLEAVAAETAVATPAEPEVIREKKVEEGDVKEAPKDKKK